MTTKRIIKFLYYQIVMDHVEPRGRKRYRITDGAFQFADWAKAMKNAGMIKKHIEFGDAVAQIDNITINKADKIWCLRVFKLRDTNVPAKVKEDEEASAVELAPGEYIGEDLFMLFDEDNGIAMIQRNRFSMGPSRLQEFFEETYKKYVDSEYKGGISLEPIMDMTNEEKLGKGDFRNLELTFANIEDMHDTIAMKALYPLLKPFKELRGVNVTIKVSTGNAKHISLDKDNVMSIVQEVKDIENANHVKRATVKMKEDDCEAEVIDLIEYNAYDLLEFDNEGSKLLDYDKTCSLMKRKYLSQKEKLTYYVKPRKA